MIRRVLEVLNQYQVVSQKLNVFQVLNLFEPLVDRHCKVVSHQFDVFRKFQISSNHLIYTLYIHNYGNKN